MQQYNIESSVNFKFSKSRSRCIGTVHQRRQRKVDYWVGGHISSFFCLFLCAVSKSTQTCRLAYSQMWDACRGPLLR